MSLEFATAVHDDMVLVSLSGELDVYTVSGLRRRLEEVDLTAAIAVVVDLTEVTLLDSSGIGVLVSLLNRVRERHGAVGLVCPNRRLRRVFEITGLRRSFAFGDDLATVRATLGQPPAPEAT